MASLFVNTSRVKVGIKAPHFQSKGDLLNCYDTMDWITSRKNLVGWTYSFDSKYLEHFKHLIVGSGDTKRSNVKFAHNVHQKVYIGRYQMLVSSANLVSPTIQNVSVIIRDPTLINHMRITFNKQWRTI